jgi:mRNA interferase RelE/StbE
MKRLRESSAIETVREYDLRQLSKLNSPEYDSIKARIYALPDDPRPPGCRKLVDTAGWRIRSGSYRIVYEIDEATKVVTVLKIAHRKDVYR